MLYEIKMIIKTLINDTYTYISKLNIHCPYFHHSAVIEKFLFHHLFICKPLQTSQLLYIALFIGDQRKILQVINHLFVYPSTRPSFSPSVRPSVCMSFRLSFCLIFCLSVLPSFSFSSECNTLN